MNNKNYNTAMELADLYKANFEDHQAMCSHEPTSVDIWSAFLKGHLAGSQSMDDLKQQNKELIELVRKISVNSVEAKTSGFWERLCQALEKPQS